jgi:monoamine oxidase
MGAVMKILFRFEERFWPEDLTMLGCDGPVRLWWTPLYGRTDGAPVLTAYVGGYRARALSAQTEADAIAVARDDLDRIFPEVTPSQLVRDAKRIDWCTNENTRGGYSFVRLGGAGSRGALAAPDTGALFWAGDGTATATIAAVVHAAYDTGKRSAAEVTTHLSR